MLVFADRCRLVVIEGFVFASRYIADDLMNRTWDLDDLSLQA